MIKWILLAMVCLLLVSSCASPLTSGMKQSEAEDLDYLRLARITWGLISPEREDNIGALDDISEWLDRDVTTATIHIVDAVKLAIKAAQALQEPVSRSGDDPLVAEAVRQYRSYNP